MENTALQTGLLRLIRQARKVELAWVDTVREEEKEARGTLENWSAKELLAHLASWRRRGEEELQAASAGEAPPPPRDMDASNAETFATAQGRTWQEVWDESERAYTGLVSQLERLPVKVVVEQEQRIWPIMAYGGKHPYRHLAENYQLRGDLAKATSLYEEMIEELRHMPLPPPVLGLAMYQLASFYAATEQRTKALEAARLAIQLDPKITAQIERDEALRPLMNSEVG